MPQRKKKPNAFQNQKLERARHKNEFLCKLKHTINTACGEDVYSLIPPIVIDNAYNGRCHSVKFVAAEGHKVSNEILNDIRAILSAMLKRTKIPYTEEGHEIFLDDFFTAIYTIVSLNTGLKYEKFQGVTKVQSALGALVAGFNNIEFKAGESIKNILIANYSPRFKPWAIIKHQPIKTILMVLKPTYYVAFI
jgi:hypothetical protein